MALYNAPRRGPKTGESRGLLGETLADTDVMGMIAVDTSSGKFYKATDAASRKVVGVNDGGERNKTLDVDYIVASRGVYLFQNSTTSAVAAKDVGAVCYVEDWQTVRISGSSHSVVAGRVEDVSTAGVYVNVGNDQVVASGS